MQLIPQNNIRETLMHHKRTIGIDHVTVTFPDEDGYVGLLLIIELDKNSHRHIQYVTTQQIPSLQHYLDTTEPSASSMLSSLILAAPSLPIQ